MGDFVPPGSCDKELEKAKKAKDDLDKAYKAYQDSDSNLQGAGWGLGAGGIGAVGCLGFFTGVGAVACIAGASAWMISESHSIAGSAGALRNAADDLEDSLDAMDDAVDALCKCLNDNMLSGPD
jgi:hypothetical protein